VKPPRCAAYYYLNGSGVRVKTKDRCQMFAEWRVEWQVNPSDQSGEAQWQGMAVCRNHITQAQWDAVEGGALDGDVHLLNIDSQYDWTIGTDTDETRLQYQARLIKEAKEEESQ
jgi:hypothetical protein